ncbi:MAG: hypothetical protein EOP53_01225 [Sphingobacteriales bacterium]|nr:MAG: hypothetical protein EOP53_01225 [Sphingobacteriales bacterium]
MSRFKLQYIILFFLLIFLNDAFAQKATPSAKSDPPKQNQNPAPENRPKKISNSDWNAKNMNSAGYEIGTPQLKNGAKSGGIWEGRYVDIAGILSFGYMKQMVSYQDSGKTLYTPGTYFYGGAQICYSLFKNNVFDIYPFWGAGIQYNKAQNGIRYNAQNEDRAIETNALGGYLSGGVGVTVGPFTAKAKMTGIASINFNKANEVKGLQYFPSLTIGLKPGRILMNPYMFSAAGLHYRSEVKDEKYTQVDPTHIQYSYTVKTTFNEGSANVYDVRPYFFIAPAYNGSIIPDQARPARNYGLQTGFRYGSLYMDANYMQGNFGFKDPIKRDGYVEKMDRNYGAGRMDGAFINSSRYSFRLGLELITWAAKSNFIAYSDYNVSKLKRATSYYAIIPNFSVGKMNLGKAQFTDSSGESTFNQYIAENSLVREEQTPFINGAGNLKNKTYYTAGCMFILGTVSFDYDFYFLKVDSRKVNLANTWGVSWKLPVARIFRIGKVMRLENQNR